MIAVHPAVPQAAAVKPVAMLAAQLATVLPLALALAFLSTFFLSTFFRDNADRGCVEPRRFLLFFERSREI